MYYQWLTIGAVLAALIRPFRSRQPALLVVRPGSLGDALLFTGALRALRRQFPGHRIVLAASYRALPVFERSPYVDTMATFDEAAFGRSNWVSRLRRLQFAIQLISRRYDRIILATAGRTLSRLSALSAQAGADNPPTALPWSDALVGIACAAIKIVPDDRVIAVKSPAKIFTARMDPGMHELDRIAAILRAAGCVAVRMRKDIWPEPGLTDPDRQWARDRLRDAWPTPEPFLPPEPRTTKTEPFFTLALCPGARFKQKSWGASNYAALLRALSEDASFRDMRVVFLGGPDDREIVAEIIAKLPDRPPPSALRPPPSDLTGQATLHQAMAVIEQSDLCVGNDTFGLHAAIAVGTPSVVLMWGGDGERWAPWGDPARHRMVRAETECGACDGVCRKSVIECMQLIEPETVLQEIKRLVTDVIDVSDEPTQACISP